MIFLVKLFTFIIVLFGTVTITYAEDVEDFVIPPQYYSIFFKEFDTTFSEGLAWVRLQKYDNNYTGNIGVIDRKGNLLFRGYNLNIMSPLQYSFSEGVSRAVDNEGNWVYINKTGKVVLKTDYDYVLNFNDGLAGVLINNKWGFIDHTGKVVIKAQYDDIGDKDGGKAAGTSGFFEGMAAVKKNGKWGYIDKTGKEVVKPTYELAYNFSDGLALVYKNNKFGHVNKSGKEMIPLKYNDTTNFSEGIARVFDFSPTVSSTLLINKSGKTIKKLDGKYNFVYNFKDGVAAATYADSNYEKVYALLDRNGNVIIELRNKYSDIEDFKNGLAEVTKSGKLGFIDTTGKEIIKPSYSSVYGSSDGLIAVGVRTGNEFLYGFIANPLDVPSSWTKAEVEASRALNIIPLDIDHSYQNDITRAEFSKLALHTLATAKKQPLEDLLIEESNMLDTSKITDTSDPEVLAAYSLGIIAGKGNNKLEPNGLITREEAATMIARVAEKLSISNQGSENTFADQKNIADWAKEHVEYVSSIKEQSTNYSVMSTVGNNNFSPKSSFTKQQAFMSMKRLVNATK